MVLPRPISSARMPESPFSYRLASQRRPSSWYPFRVPPVMRRGCRKAGRPSASPLAAAIFASASAMAPSAAAAASCFCLARCRGEARWPFLRLRPPAAAGEAAACSSLAASSWHWAESRSWTSAWQPLMKPLKASAFCSRKSSCDFRPAAVAGACAWSTSGSAWSRVGACTSAGAASSFSRTLAASSFACSWARIMDSVM
mmetsp:Transcript_42233/g.66072  ORF Transcript_42233/g.66072 Transcript_42233/m.66072 type:complete len:200 (+) Transcript_42233:1447-2046(+)